MRNWNALDFHQRSSNVSPNLESPHSWAAKTSALVLHPYFGQETHVRQVGLGEGGKELISSLCHYPCISPVHIPSTQFSLHLPSPILPPKSSLLAGRDTHCPTVQSHIALALTLRANCSWPFCCRVACFASRRVPYGSFITPNAGAVSAPPFLWEVRIELLIFTLDNLQLVGFSMSLSVWIYERQGERGEGT